VLEEPRGISTQCFQSLCDFIKDHSKRFWLAFVAPHRDLGKIAAQRLKGEGSPH
jgi:hypothetical protein